MLPDVEHDRNHFSKGFFVHVIVMPGVATLGQNSKIIFGFNNSKNYKSTFSNFRYLKSYYKCKYCALHQKCYLDFSFFKEKCADIYKEGPEFCNIYLCIFCFFGSKWHILCPCFQIEPNYIIFHRM